MQVSGVAILVPQIEGKARLDVVGRPMFELNAAAAIIWENLALGLSTQEIIGLLVARFSIPEERAANDVITFIELLKQHLLVFDDTESTAR
jgi:Coenzyme PQQ synthesis protein D (PqqD)